jgi:hypothetical protein
MRKISLFLVLALTVFILAAQQPPAAQSPVPDNVSISLDALLKTRTSNQVFNMKFLNHYFFALQKAPTKVYVNILFSADLDEDTKALRTILDNNHQQMMDNYNKMVEQKQKELEETNKQIEGENRGKQKDKQKPLQTWEKPPAPEKRMPAAFHNLYLRIVQDGNVIQNYKSRVPLDDEACEYLSFGLILAPGKYDVLINVNRFDNTEDGTLLIELTVPELTLQSLVQPMKNIELVQPVFYKEMRTASQMEQRFTVLKNEYQVGQQVFMPYLGDEITLKNSSKPILTFFIKGAASIVDNRPRWELLPHLEILKGKKKESVYKMDPIRAPYFFQKLEFKKGNELLAPGDYTLSVTLEDTANKGRKGTVEIPFKLVE